MQYRTPQDFDKALKSAIKRRVGSDSSAYNKMLQEFVFERFLTRIFMEEIPSFALKGGMGLLARIPDARTTTDIDLSATRLGMDESVKRLVKLASVDLEDFMTFQFKLSEPMSMSQTQPAREGVVVHFSALLGTTVSDIRLEVVRQPEFSSSIVKALPARRLGFPGLTHAEFVMIPIEQQIAEKVCATVQLYQGHESSRVKDLIDLVGIARSLSISKRGLKQGLENEAHFRNLQIGETFEVPNSWRTNYQSNPEHGTAPKELREIGAATKLVNTMLDLGNEQPADSIWNYSTLEWERP